MFNSGHYTASTEVCYILCCDVNSCTRYVRWKELFCLTSISYRHCLVDCIFKTRTSLSVYKYCLYSFEHYYVKNTSFKILSWVKSSFLMLIIHTLTHNYNIVTTHGDIHIPTLNMCRNSHIHPLKYWKYSKFIHARW